MIIHLERFSHFCSLQLKLGVQDDRGHPVRSTSNDRKYSVLSTSWIKGLWQSKPCWPPKKQRKNILSAICPFSVSLSLRDQSEFHMMQNQLQNGKRSGGRIGNIIQKKMYAIISWVTENTITDMYSFDTVKLEMLKHQHSKISQFHKAGKITMNKKSHSISHHAISIIVHN